MNIKNIIENGLPWTEVDCSIVISIFFRSGGEQYIIMKYLKVFLHRLHRYVDIFTNKCIKNILVCLGLMTIKINNYKTILINNIIYLNKNKSDCLI